MTDVAPDANGALTKGANTNLHSIFDGPMKLDDYYPAITINSLVNILRDPMLNSHHEKAVQITSR
jgi:hypothetical protein